MFLLVSGHHVGAHTDGHQHGVSIQISINLGKKFLRISRIRKIAVTRILARVFAYLLSFISQILDSIHWPVLFCFVLIFLFWSILNCVTLKTSNWLLFLHDARTRYPLVCNQEWNERLAPQQHGSSIEVNISTYNISLSQHIIISSTFLRKTDVSSRSIGLNI